MGTLKHPDLNKINLIENDYQDLTKENVLLTFITCQHKVAG
jgi:hypothetical protein